MAYHGDVVSEQFDSPQIASSGHPIETELARARVIDELRARRPLSVKWEQAPAPLLPAWVADMDLPAPEVVRRTVADAVARGDVGYASGALDERYRSALSHWSKARTGYEPEDVLLVGDVLGGLALALWTLTEPGSGVVVPTPSYPPFLSIPTSLGRQVVTLPLLESDDYRLDPERLDRTLTASGAKALILCNPHNPTGRVATREELVAVAEVVERHHVVVISDEIHQDILRQGVQHVPWLSLDHPAIERSVGLSAATKTFNIAGLKAAHVEAGSVRVAELLRDVEVHLRSAPTPMGLLAAAVAWEQGGEWLESTLERIQENLETAAIALVGTGRMRTSVPAGTYLLWVQVLGLGAESAAAWARRAGVVVSGGETFDTQGRSDWMRLNVATEPEVLAEVLDRLVGMEAS